MAYGRLSSMSASVESPQARDDFCGMIGESAPMLEIFARIRMMAKSSAPVFIGGETGTGKEVAAAAIHTLSGRKGPFIAVNCGSIPRELVESELFGHRKGSFTGAVADRKGAAAFAHGGTLFLDEICEMEVDQQIKLLRFVQSGSIQPVGSARSEKVDVRILCATNRDPLREVSLGRFRQDLYFRLHVLSLKMPPLRQRGGDILLLARHFLAAAAAEEGKRFLKLSQESEALLLAYHWPGNVRELESCIRQAVVLHDSETLSASMLSLPAAALPGLRIEPEAMGVAGLRRTHAAMDILPAFLGRELWRIERDVIEATLAAVGGSVPKAAKLLGVSPSTLYRKREGWEVPNQH